MLCEKSGGVAVLVYNDEPGMFTGGLAEPTSATIPAVSISREDGLELLANHLNRTVEVQDQQGYGYLSGTVSANYL